MDTITTKDDLYKAIRGYKYQHCPVLAGLDKGRLNQLIDKFDLRKNVVPTGKRVRPDGRGRGRKWDVKPKRKKTTWESKKDRTKDIDGMDVRFTGLVNKTTPLQQKRKDVAAAAEEPKKPKMKLRFKK